MILPIYLYGQPVLKKVSEDIDAEYPNLKELIENMFDTMHQAQGIGLAAPQIGLAIRLVVIDLDGNKIEGELNPSSDTPTHLELYRRITIRYY